jgi:hypothetical protein
LWERAGREFERRRREQVLAMLQTIARKHLGQIGVPLVETEFAKFAGIPLSAAQLPELFASLAVVAQHLIDFPQIDLMLDEMSKGAHGLLNSAESGPTSSDHLP